MVESESVGVADTAHVGVSQNGGPSYSTLFCRILVVRTPKYGTPYFRKLPCLLSGIGIQVEEFKQFRAMGPPNRPGLPETFFRLRRPHTHRVIGAPIRGSDLGPPLRVDSPKLQRLFGAAVLFGAGHYPKRREL